MTTLPLFRYPTISSLPERGSYNPRECLAECQETIEYSLQRYTEWSSQPGRAADIQASAQHLFTESAGDLEKLLPHLQTDDELAAAHRVGELRDRLRELFGDHPATPEPFTTTSEAEQIEEAAADLCASLQRQIGTAAILTRQAGPPPLTDRTRGILCEAWKGLARTIINTAELPGLNLATLDALETLSTAADALRALWDDGQP